MFGGKRSSSEAKRMSPAKMIPVQAVELSDQEWNVSARFET